jgi:hypothetical protein
MNPEFEVLGIGRTPMNSEEFRKKAGEAAAKSKDTRDFSASGWADCETRLHYMVGDINDPKSYSQLCVKNPSVSRLFDSGNTPSNEKRPWVGLNPVTPQKDPGRNTDPAFALR